MAPYPTTMNLVKAYMTAPGNSVGSVNPNTIYPGFLASCVTKFSPVLVTATPVYATESKK